MRGVAMLTEKSCEDAERVCLCAADHLRMMAYTQPDQVLPELLHRQKSKRASTGCRQNACERVNGKI